MSTRSTCALWEGDGIEVHLYHELCDGAYHLQITGETYSALDVIVANWMVEGLTRMIEGNRPKI